MYRVVKRDGRIVDFDIVKINNAMEKAFIATETNYTPSVIDFLGLKVTADFTSKIKDGFSFKKILMFFKETNKLSINNHKGKEKPLDCYQNCI